MDLRRRSPPLSPASIVVSSSQDWDGNDGPWSLFSLQVGTSAQKSQSLDIESGYQTWVVVPQGCTPTDPLDCVSSLEVQFESYKSTTWVSNNVTSSETFALELETNLGYTGHGKDGYDTSPWAGKAAEALPSNNRLWLVLRWSFMLGHLALIPSLPTSQTLIIQCLAI